jgi:membrane protease subunit HflK
MIEAILENLSGSDRKKESAIKGWRKIKKWGKITAAGIFGAATIYSSFYTIPADSQGVIKRFGKFVRITEPGIHLKIPLGVESATKVPVKKVQKEEFGFRTLEAGVDSRYLDSTGLKAGKVADKDMSTFVKSFEVTPEANPKLLQNQVRDLLRSEYLMLTGDLNMADVQWIIQYKIKNPADYLFNIRNPKQTIRDASQAVMRRIIGNGSVDEAITIGRIENEISEKEELQKILDDYQTGIHIVTAKLQSSNPPHRVRPAFNKVNESMQQKEQKINEAMQDYNKEVPKARGEAIRVVETAKGYGIERVNNAEGDVDKFLRVLKEYKKAPKITKQRLYLETMTEVLPQIPEKMIIEDKGLVGGIYKMFRLDTDKSLEKVIKQNE